MTPAIESTEEGRYDILGNLPKEVCCKILSYLTPEDVASSFDCCRKWQEHIDYNYIWKTIYTNVCTEPEDEPSTGGYQKMLQLYPVHWQGRYMYNRALKFNIENGKYKRYSFNVTEEGNHRFIYFDDNILILSVADFTFLIFNSSTGLIKWSFTFKDHSAAIKHNDELIAITKSGHLMIWNIESRKCTTDVILKEIAESKYVVNKLLACKHLIIIIMEERKILIFDRRQSNVVWYVEDDYEVCCTADTVAMIGYKGNIDILDSNLKVMYSLDCAAAFIIATVEMKEDFLVKEFIDHKFKYFYTIWDIKARKKFSIRMRIMPRGFKSNYHIISKNTLMCITGLTTWQMWNMSTQSYMFEIDFGEDILDFTFHGSYLYTFEVQNHCRVWCTQTGSCVGDLRLSTEKFDIIGKTTSKLLCKYNHRRKDCWEILDYENNMAKPEE